MAVHEVVVRNQNLGSHGDYTNVADANDKMSDLFLDSRPQPDTVSEKRMDLFKAANEGSTASIYCFQEVYDLARPILQALGEQFEAFKGAPTGTGGPDVMIAWDTTRFEKVSEYANRSGGHAIVGLKEKSTEIVYAVISAHLTGYRIPGFDPTLDADEQGNHELKTLLKTLDGSGADVTILAMDANAIPEHPRLKIMDKQGQPAYVRDVGNAAATTIDLNSDCTEMKLDYVFARGSEGYDIENIKDEIKLKLNDPENNPGDHVMTETTIKVTKRPSFWRKSLSLLATPFRWLAMPFAWFLGFIGVL